MQAPIGRLLALLNRRARLVEVRALSVLGLLEHGQVQSFFLLEDSVENDPIDGDFDSLVLSLLLHLLELKIDEPATVELSRLVCRLLDDCLLRRFLVVYFLVLFKKLLVGFKRHNIRRPSVSKVFGPILMKKCS